MNPDMRQHMIRPSGCLAGPAAVALLGCLALTGSLLPGMALAQTAPQRPGEVPFLNYPPVTIPGNSAPQPATQPKAQPKAPPAAKAANGSQTKSNAAPATSAKRPSSPGTLTPHDQELAAVQANQKSAIENEAKLKREIAAIGDDRRKLNQQLIDTVARVRAVEDEIAKTEERIGPLDEREQELDE